MKIWILKAIIQKIISFLPFKFKINYLFQKYITKTVSLTDRLFEDRLTHCKNHLHYFEKYSKTENGTSLEIGTGWFPVVPIGLYLSGFKEIFSVDISSHISNKTVNQTIQRFLEYHKSGKLNNYIPDIEPSRINKLEELSGSNLEPSALLNEINIRIIIEDASKTKFSDNTFDLINSNYTFEHIYFDMLHKILAEFKRILKPNGIMSHFIDMTDNFYHLDNKITPFNFLKFSEKKWKLIDNSIQPQNRMRFNDFKCLFQDLELEILEEIIYNGSTNDLKSIKLSDRFKNYEVSDLLITHCQLIATKR